eukprot:1868090-Amphidinium_carterae.1
MAQKSTKFGRIVKIASSGCLLREDLGGRIGFWGRGALWDLMKVVTNLRKRDPLKEQSLAKKHYVQCALL